MIVVTNSDILGKNIHHLRKKKQITVQELAGCIDWNTSALQELEEGRCFDIPSQVLVRVCTFFNVEMDSFMTKEIIG